MSRTRSLSKLIGPSGSQAFDTNTLVIDAANNRVGIGTISPDQSLDVTRSGDGDIAVFQTTATHGVVLSAPSSTTLQIASVQGSKNLDLWANTLSFSAGGSERIRIHSEGYTELKSSDSYNQLVLTPSGTNAPASINFNTPGTGRAQIKVQNNEYLSILSTGNVGIGTASPQAKLEVAGTFKQGQYVRIPLNIVWSNGTSNQTARISLGTSVFWGTIKVTVTSQYSVANAVGVYSKIYSCGLNSNSPYTNSSQIAENSGETSKHFQLENYMSWDSTNSEWYLGIHHLEASGNQSDILLEAWCTSDTFANNLLNAYTSSVTTDSDIAFMRPEYSSYTISQVQAVGSENNYVHDGLQLLFDAHHGFINGQAPYCLITGTTAIMAGTASTSKQNIGGVNCLEISDDGNVQWLGKVQGTPRTYEIWVYHKDADPSTRGWESYFDDSSSEKILFGKQGSSNLLSVYQSGAMDNVIRGQKWFQVAYTIDDTSQNYSIRLFFNGELVSQGYNVYAQVLTGAGGTLYMGGDAGSECLNGYIALARVYNRALSNEELRQNFDNNRERFGI